jgi:hypothetical protein
MEIEASAVFGLLMAWVFYRVVTGRSVRRRPFPIHRPLTPLEVYQSWEPYRYINGLSRKLDDHELAVVAARSSGISRFEFEQR